MTQCEKFSHINSKPFKESSNSEGENLIAFNRNKNHYRKTTVEGLEESNAIAPGEGKNPHPL